MDLEAKLNAAGITGVTLYKLGPNDWQVSTRKSGADGWAVHRGPLETTLAHAATGAPGGSMQPDETKSKPPVVAPTLDDLLA